MQNTSTFFTDIFTSESTFFILVILLCSVIILFCLKAIRLSARYRRVMLDLPLAQNNNMIKWHLSTSKIMILQNTLNFLPRMIFGKVTFDFIDIIFIYSSLTILFLGIKYLINIIL